MVARSFIFRTKPSILYNLSKFKMFQFHQQLGVCHGLAVCAKREVPDLDLDQCRDFWSMRALLRFWDHKSVDTRASPKSATHLEWGKEDRINWCRYFGGKEKKHEKNPMKQEQKRRPENPRHWKPAKETALDTNRLWAYRLKIDRRIIKLNFIYGSYLGNQLEKTMIQAWWYKPDQKCNLDA